MNSIGELVRLALNRSYFHCGVGVVIVIVGTNLFPLA